MRQSQRHPDPIAFMKNSLACQALADTATRVSGDAGYSAHTPTSTAFPFGQYAAEQIAQQVQHHYEGTGRPTPVVLTTIRAAARQAPVTANIDSLKIEDARERGAPGVYDILHGKPIMNRPDSTSCHSSFEKQTTSRIRGEAPAPYTPSPSRVLGALPT